MTPIFTPHQMSPAQKEKLSAYQLSPTRYRFGDYFITIGLEIHVALQTPTKLMSAAPNSFSSDFFAPVDAGLPGAMPVVDAQALEQAVAFGLTFKSRISPETSFDRKHYFYSDLSIGYQITQQFQPIVVGGSVEIPFVDYKGIKEISGESAQTQPRKEIYIEHAHLECDAAKSLHDKFAQFTAIDLSRGGSALLEIVSYPVMYAPEEAVSYAQAIYEACVALGICDGKQEEGSFRIDASISLSKDPVSLGTRVEIKNLSAFSYMRQALLYEIERQSETLSSGKKVAMDTVLYDEDTGETRSMRSKESVADYRYMPDPDIPSIILEPSFIEKVSQDYLVDYQELRAQLEQLLIARDIKPFMTNPSFFIEVLGQTSPTQALWLQILKEDKSLSGHTLEEKSISASALPWPWLALRPEQQTVLLKTLIYTLPPLLTSYGALAMKSSSVESASTVMSALHTQLYEDLVFLAKSTLSSSDTKTVLEKYLSSLNSDKPLSLQNCMPQFIDMSELQTIIVGVLAAHPEQVRNYLAGQEKLLQFLTGKCMAQLKGKASAAQTQQILREEIAKIK